MQNDIICMASAWLGHASLRTTSMSTAEPIDPVRAPDPIEVRGVFPEPIEAAETIARYATLPVLPR
jgi:hypothetical protein